MDENISVSDGLRTWDIEKFNQKYKERKPRKESSVKPAKNGLLLTDAPHGCMVNLLYNGVCGEFWSDTVFRVTKHRTTEGQVIAFNQRNERVFLHPSYKFRIVEE